MSYDVQSFRKRSCLCLALGSTDSFASENVAGKHVFSVARVIEGFQRSSSQFGWGITLEVDNGTVGTPSNITELTSSSKSGSRVASSLCGGTASHDGLTEDHAGFSDAVLTGVSPHPVSLLEIRLQAKAFFE